MKNLKLSILSYITILILLLSCSKKNNVNPTTTSQSKNNDNISDSNRAFFLGHSLVNFEIPNMVQRLCDAASQKFSYQSNIGNGANLEMHWTNPHSPGSQGNVWDTTLDNGGFNQFIVTEAIPLKNHLRFSNTYGYADSFYNYANHYNAGIHYYLYETWHCINSGTPTGCEWDDDDHLNWRQRLTADLPLWESIADSINKKHGTNSMYIIPAGQALANLYDQIIAGKVPGITNIRSLFTDDIHLNSTGNYFIACVMYSTLQKRSPEGLPNQLNDNSSIPYTNYPSTVQATIFQRIAWHTVSGYARCGVR